MSGNQSVRKAWPNGNSIMACDGEGRKEAYKLKQQVVGWHNVAQRHTGTQWVERNTQAKVRWQVGVSCGSMVENVSRGNGVWGTCVPPPCRPVTQKNGGRCMGIRQSGR